jgi:hypothetical protein
LPSTVRELWCNSFWAIKYDYFTDLFRKGHLGFISWWAGDYRENIFLHRCLREIVIFCQCFRLDSIHPISGLIWFRGNVVRRQNFAVKHYWRYSKYS